MSASRPGHVQKDLHTSAAGEVRKPPRRRRGALPVAEASFVCDGELAVSSWTEAASLMFGWSAGEMHGRPVFEALQSEFDQLGLDEAGRRLRADGFVRARVTHTRKDGKRLVVELTASELRGAEGERTGFVCVNRAVGSDAETFPGGEFGRTLLDQVPGVFWMTDADLRITFASGTALAHRGLLHNRWIGKTVYDFFGTDAPAFPPVGAHLRALGGEPADCEIERGEQVFRCRIAPVLNTAGMIVGVVGAAEDVSAQVRTERELVAQKSLLETIIHQAADGISVCDLSGHFTLINDAARTSAGPEFFTQQGPLPLATARTDWSARSVDEGRTLSREEWPVSRALKGEVTSGAEIQVRRPDGSMFYARVSAAPVRDAEGNVVAAVVTTAEITAQKTTERELRQRTELLRLVLESIGAGVIVVDETGKVAVFNPAASAILRDRPENIPIGGWDSRFGVYRSDQVTPYAIDEIPVMRALRGESADEPEIFLRTPKVPEGIWVNSASRPLVDESGAVRGAVVVFHDITAQKAAAEEIRGLNADLERRVVERTADLERSRSLLRQIIDNTTAVIYLKDRTARYLLVNSQYEKLFHVSQAEAVGKTDYELIGADWAPAVRANDRVVLEANRPLQFEEVVPQDDGPHTYVSVKFPLYGPDGAAFGVCGISTDITARKRIETELGRSEASLSALIESSTDAIWSVDRDYRLLKLNAVTRRLFLVLLDTRPAVGDSVLDFSPREIGLRWRDHYDRALAGERLELEEAAVIDGVNRSYLVSMSPIRESSGVIGVTVFAKDITDLKRAADEVRRHQAELARVLRLNTVGEMAASLAHEINQPLGAISNYALGCKRRIEAGPAKITEVLGALDEISHQALRAGEVVRGLRNLVRKREIRRERVSLNEIAADALRLLGAEIQRRGVKVTEELSPDHPIAWGDAVQLEQVVLNLLLNAIEAMDSVEPVERRLTVRTVPTADGRTGVTVADSGPGLAPAIADRVFEPFLSTKPEGLGMGLAISRSIIEAHYGQIRLTPNPDRGTTFSFTVPSAGT